MRTFPAFKGPMHKWPRVEAVPGIQTVLEELGGSIKICLATNAEDSHEADIRKALARCGLSDLFDNIFCFRQVGFRKPEPAFFKKILETLELQPSSVYMVGDSFENDVQAANIVGIPAVWFNPSSAQSKSGPLHLTIHRYEDLGSALQELGAKVC